MLLRVCSFSMAGENEGKRRSCQTVAVILILCSLVPSLTCFSLRWFSKKAPQEKEVSEAAVTEVRPGNILFNGRELSSDLGSVPGNNGLLHVDLDQTGDTETEQMSQLKDIMANEAAWRRLNATLHCGQTQMKLKAMGPGAADLQLNMGNARYLPLTQVPEICGYSLQQNALGLDLVAPYNGCNVIHENGNHVILMSWRETPVKLICHMLPSPDSSPPKSAQHPWNLSFSHGPWSHRRHKRQANLPYYDPRSPYYPYWYYYMQNMRPTTTAAPSTTAEPGTTTTTTKPAAYPYNPYLLYYLYYYYYYSSYYPLPTTTTAAPTTTTGPATNTTASTTKAPPKPSFPFHPPYYHYPYYYPMGQQAPGNGSEIYYYPFKRDSCLYPHNYFYFYFFFCSYYTNDKTMCPDNNHIHRWRRLSSLFPNPSPKHDICFTHSPQLVFMEDYDVEMDEDEEGEVFMRKAKTGHWWEDYRDRNCDIQPQHGGRGCMVNSRSWAEELQDIFEPQAEDCYGGRRSRLSSISMVCRLQSGVNLQVCFVNDSSSDKDSDAEDSRTETSLDTPLSPVSKQSSSLSDRDTAEEDSDPLDDCSGFWRVQRRLQEEARVALALARPMARMQVEVERQIQLHRRLNEELVQLLLMRDELHVEQDAMLVDIEDLTRHAHSHQRHQAEKAMSK
ncbi:hypothetical protein INR49_012965 [Caranx melampygus]|nr:hypothetical protein INR49_012965 [Caranx melampygus]